MCSLAILVERCSNVRSIFQYCMKQKFWISALRDICQPHKLGVDCFYFILFVEEEKRFWFVNVVNLVTLINEMFGYW